MTPEARETLAQMREAALEVAEHLNGADYAAYLANRTMRRAIERCVSIMGEAAYRLRLTKAVGLEQLNLIDVERMRHVIVHGYDRMRDDLVYMAATEDCPNLVRAIDAVLESNP
jgi:uncharacterized protein with HEPN domain